MTNDLVAAMRQAALSARHGRVVQATLITKSALAGSHPTHDAAGSAGGPEEFPVLQNVGTEPDLARPQPRPAAGSLHARGNSALGEKLKSLRRARKPLREVLEELRRGGIRLPVPGLTPALHGSSLKASCRQTPIPDGASFLERSFTCSAGSRRYKLYIPASTGDKPGGLVVMLHGCKQNPDDFAAGTNMNGLAEANGLLVAYPGQSGSDNASSCWNWFRPGDQERDSGEPAIIAGLTREIVREFGLDGRQVFVAGLSAGGAMAAIMGETYPDLYKAVGVHSGLAPGSASDVISALATMRGDAVVTPGPRRREQGGKDKNLRMIVFHGSEDRTVHPSNAARLVAEATPHSATAFARQVRKGRSGGRNYALATVKDSSGASIVESWLIDGAGHAWSGGHSSGSFADPHGPDASAEMVRFFLERP